MEAEVGRTLSIISSRIRERQGLMRVPYEDSQLRRMSAGRQPTRVVSDGTRYTVIIA
jgi:hypothetical protein